MRDDLQRGSQSPHLALLSHLQEFAGDRIDVQDWHVPNGWAPHGFSTVTMSPSEQLPFWTFATVGCWQAPKDCHWRSEFVVAGSQRRDYHVHLLKMAALFHLDPQSSITYSKIMQIGDPWAEGSECNHLLASLPYPYGERFEWPDVVPCTRFVWLLPITASEATFAEVNGVEALEQLFDDVGLPFADERREPAIR